MSKFKVCVYAICKNEEKFADRWINSMKEADLVVVVDTGSDDATAEKLKESGAIVYHEKVEPWRFDAARNISLDYVPADVDICVCTDLDEVLEPGWRQKLEDAWRPEYTRGSYLYNWSLNLDGTPRIQFQNDKIHCRNGYRWSSPVHEDLVFENPQEEKIVYIDGVVLNHYPDLSKSRGQYLPLLELSAAENPFDNRIMFWLGREYLYHGKYDSSIETLKKHIKLPNAVWDEELSASMRFIGDAYQAMSNTAEAFSWYLRSIAQCPNVREPYLRLAKLSYLEQNWPMVYAMVDRGLGITKKSGSYLTEPDCWGASLYDLGAISAYQLGLYEKAQEYAIKATELDSSDERLKNNLKIIERAYLKGGQDSE